MVASFAAASPAGASTLYACVKKNGSAHLFSHKPNCKKGESKLAWNTPGPAGKNGTNGAAGANGKNGAAGSNGTNGTNGVAGQPQKGFVFNSTLAANFEPPTVSTLFSVSGVTVKLLCFNFIANIAKLEASGPAGSRAETGMVVTNEKSEAPGVTQEPVKDVAVGPADTTILQLTSNTSGTLRNIAHVNGSILTSTALVVFDAFMSTGPNPEGCIARGGAFSIPL